MTTTTGSGWRHAFGLTRQAVKDASPPGTVALVDHSVHEVGGNDGGRYRYEDRVNLYPIPTTSPADPLTWSRWRKGACMASLAMYAFVANYISASMAPALPLWNCEFHRDRRPLHDLMQLVAFNVLAVGLGNVFWVPLSNIVGRRLVLVASTFVLLVATGCGIGLSGFTTTLIIRVFQGLGSSASETVVPAVVGDLFFVHERGGWMAFYTASLASGSVVGGITGGYVANDLGWFAQFLIATYLAGAAFACAVFLVPETMFDRPRPSLPTERNIPRFSRIFDTVPEPGSIRELPIAYNPAYSQLSSASWRLSLGSLPSMTLTIPSIFKWEPAPSGASTEGMPWYGSTNSDEDLSGSTAALEPGAQPRPVSSTRSTVRTAPRSEHPRYTFADSIRFGHYRGKVWYQLRKPWSTLRLPAVWVIMLQYGGLVGGVAVISTVGPQILSLPPYRWGQNAGLLFVGALVGIILGGFCTGLLADRQLKKRAHEQDYGYAEPESRLVLMVPALLIGTGGLLVFGFCAQYPGRYQWIGLECAYGMLAFALAQVPSIWFGYLIDAYDNLASDCFVMICILRGLIPFAWTFFVAQWVERDGYLVPFCGFSGILGGFALLTIPILVVGKRMRIATAVYVEDNQ
ncbi:major facilitator superfamily domain-containing protein [Chaetomium strumarium]|uniref:Major facilitator superfamily domain-containing protein n=1 Tax=Chaetomium strumarium TaxID=1170767 RepID=A0AAJ0GYH4_9PEZI|nr:major facilitator superfamily domain-containing protein [Chaetomium strumarium]